MPEPHEGREPELVVGCLIPFCVETVPIATGIGEQVHWEADDPDTE